jgi:DNA-binding transcriptional LysR family regulator
MVLSTNEFFGEDKGELMLDRWRLMLFRELARTGTVAGAAQTVCVTPSAVSQQLRLLQREAGIDLFERNGRRLELTPGGVAFLDHANEILNRFEEAEVALAVYRKEVVGTVRLAAFPSVANLLAPIVMTRMHAQHSRLRIVLNELEPDEAVAQLRSGQQDIVVIDNLDPSLDLLSGNVAQQPLLVDPLVVAVHRGHPFEQRPHLTLADLAEQTWITEPPGRYFESTLRSACLKAGFEPIVSAHVRDTQAFTALIGAGCGISVLPRLVVSRSREVVAIPLRPKWTRRVSLVTRAATAPHPVIRAIDDCFASAAAEYLADVVQF